MKLTTRARYGTRALLDIALSPTQPVQLKNLAERQGISKKYLEQLLAPLRDAGLLQTVRGPAGGYQLARPLTELRLGEVLRILEGPLELTDCVADDQTCLRSAQCAARQIWQTLSAAMEQCLDRMTLADLLSIHSRLASGDAEPDATAAAAPPAPASPGRTARRQTTGHFCHPRPVGPG